MIDLHTLTQYSTLDPGTALCRITQIYQRPSLDVNFGQDRSQEWFENFLEKYHKTGQRYEQKNLSPDKLTLVVQIFWIDEEHWLAASRQDPFAVENAEISIGYCEKHGIKHTRIREIKKDGRWWASVKNLVGDQWDYVSIGNFMTSQLALPNQSPKIIELPASPLMIDTKDKNGDNL